MPGETVPENKEGKLAMVTAMADSVLKQEWKKLAALRVPPADSVARKLLRSFKPAWPRLSGTPLLSWNGGALQYGLTHNSIVDSPFAEKNILQHQLQLSARFTVARTLPVQVYFTARKSNSLFFRDIYDTRVDIDLDAARQLATREWLNNLQKNITQTGIKEAETYLQHFKQQLSGAGKWTQREDMKQQLRDYRAILHNPALIGDTLASHPEWAGEREALLNKAQHFVHYYQQADSLYRHYLHKADSVAERLQQYRQTTAKYQLLLNRLQGEQLNPGELEAFAAEQGLSRNTLASRASGLMAKSRLSLGRSIAPPSALATSNTRINGVQFEYYNRFYYLVNAGLVDFSVRDYVSIKERKMPTEYMALLKWGLGKPQGNHFFLSWFYGRKRDYYGPRTAGGTVQAYPVSGAGTGGRLNIINRYS
ncbi:MAG: hypothetical protein JNM68_02475, partial [Dinghuibacter sp.]|nr:hypothetical protein [Dinghuibacter sp.]